MHGQLLAWSSRSRVCGTLLAALIVAALGLGPGAAEAKRQPLVVAPKPGQVFPAGSVWLRVDAGIVAASLNGERIAGGFGKRRGAVRSILASPNYGLRFGANVLRVRVRERGRVRARTVRFRIRTDGPLAAAGRDRVLAVGNRLLLDGRRSLMHPGGRAGTRDGFRYRWRIVGPQGKTRLGGAKALTGAAQPKLSFRPPRPGNYTLRLTVTAPDGASNSDLVTVRADPPPSVRIETMVEPPQRGGEIGIQITGPSAAATAFYPANPTKWLQLLVLRRSDLGLISNTNYDCPQAVNGGVASEVAECSKRVREDIAKLDESHLVIASNPIDPRERGLQPPLGMPQALGGIGVAFWNWLVDVRDGATPERGGFSAIGVPGRGSLVVEHPAYDPTFPKRFAGGIVGNLVRDNEFNYTFAPAEQLVLNTQAAGSTPDQNVIGIGATNYTQPIPGGARSGGFHVVVADPRDLTASSQWFETDHSDVNALIGQLEAMRDLLHTANAAASQPFGVKRLIVVASRGNPFFRTSSPRADEVLEQLVDEVEHAGGTRGAFFRAVDPGFSGGASYTLIGEGDSRWGSGIEGLGPAPGADGLSTVPQTGTLARSGRYYQYELQSGSSALTGGFPDQATAMTQLLQTAGQAPVPWPEQGNAGRTAAIRWIGEKVLGTDDPRSQFWTLTFNANTWSTKIAPAIEGLCAKSGECPSLPGFTASDLAWAKAELVREIGWLTSTHAYLEALAEPFQKTALTSWADLQNVAVEVNESVAADVNEEVEINGEYAKAAFDFLLELSDALPEPATNVAGSIKAIYSFGMDLAAINGVPVSAEPQIKTTVAKAGKALAERLERTQNLLTTQLPNVIASDYARLKAVGSCGSPIALNWPECPFDPKAWQYTSEDQMRAASTMLPATEAQAFGTLLPAKFEAWVLPLSPYTSANDRFAGLPLSGCEYPFGNAPLSSQLAKPLYRTIPTYADDRWEITALGYLTGAGTIDKRWVMHTPAAAVTDRLFGSGRGQLGLDKEQFFDTYFSTNRRTLDHYPERDTRTGWLPECAPKALAGKGPSVPAALPLGRAVRTGIPIAFDTTGQRSSVGLSLHLGGAARKPGPVLARRLLLGQGAGLHAVALTVPPAAARRLRASGSHRALVRIRVAAPKLRARVYTLPLRLTY